MVLTPDALVTFCSVITPDAGADDVDDRGRRLLRVHAEHLQVLGGVLDVHGRFVGGILRDLEILLRDGAAVEQVARPIELRVRELGV